VGFSQVGSFAQKEYLKAAANKDSVGMALWAEGGAGRTALHAMMGGAMSSATGGDFATGAVAAGASQAMAGALNDVFKTQPEYREAAAQIVGLTAAGLAGKDVEKAAWVSLMADQYNRQLHPDEIPLLKKQADSLAKEAGLSPAEAERRLAKALVYYTDKDWNGVLSGQGAAPDAVTVKHLGIALSPLGATYAPAAATDIPAIGPAKTYTPTETAALIANYSSTHAAQYADNSINAINLQGLFTGDLGYEYANYYRKNLAGGPGLTDWGTVSGSTQGAGKALSEAAGSAWALLSNPAQGSEQIVNGLAGLTKHPVDSLMSSVEASQTKMALASLYDMQGNTAASAAIRAQSDVEFALNFLPVNRVKTLAKLGAAGRAVDSAELASLPAGYRRVVDAKTGNTEVVGADGGFYYETAEGGLKPKAGGSLAELVAGETRVTGVKGSGSDAPYNPQTVRVDLETTYGRDNVISSTVPPIDGRNVHLAGQRHPVTGVVFDNRGFPIFDDVATFDTRISNDLFKAASYEQQMKLATKDLFGAIQQGQVKKSSFSAKQLQQIEMGARKIDGYTWHHHQDNGRMQLIPEMVHKKTGHIGGEAMGGGM
jgi:filamentous hemagglutinin